MYFVCGCESYTLIRKEMVHVKVSHLPKMDLTSVGQAVTVCEQAQLADEDHSECNVIMWAHGKALLE